MGQFFNSAIAALPSAASSWPALCAYALTIIAYAIIAWRVSRSRNLLLHLQKLPQKDRLAALEVEMGGARLSTGLSPDQWLKFRIHRYYFLALLASLATILTIVAVAISLILLHGHADVSVGLYDEPKPAGALLAQIGDTADDTGPDARRSDTVVTYFAQNEDGRTVIKPKVPYFDIIKNQRLIRHVTGEAPFTWAFPKLSFKIVNNTGDDLVVSELRLRITNSVVDRSPIPVFWPVSYEGEVSIWNLGWGPLINPRIEYSVSDCQSWANQSRSRTIAFKTLTKNISFSIHDAVSSALIDHIKTCEANADEICLGESCRLTDVPKRCLDGHQREVCEHVESPLSSATVRRIFRPKMDFGRDAMRSYLAGKIQPFYLRQCSQTPICVSGHLDYSEENGSFKKLAFRTVSILERRLEHATGGLPPSNTYDLILPAGDKGYSRSISISQEVKPGTADQFLLRLATNKTASFEMDVDVLAANGRVLWSGKMDLTIFVPREDEIRM